MTCLVPDKTRQRRVRLILHPSHGVAPELIGIVGLAVHGHRAKVVAVNQEQVAELGLADAGRVFQHRLEYRLQLAGRRTDDAQHLSRRGLLLQRSSCAIH